MSWEAIKALRDTSWPSVRAAARKQASAGGLRGLENAAALVSYAMFRAGMADDIGQPVHDTPDEESVYALWSLMRHAGHPQGWLSPRLLPEELGLGLWSFKDGEYCGYSGGYAGGLRTGEPRPKPLETGEPVELWPAEDLKEDSLPAFESIRARSNGQECFEVYRAAGPAEVSRGLAHAIADAFAPLAERRSGTSLVPAATRTSFGGVIGEMMHIAVNGGAYDRGLGPAAGRWATWRTVAILLGFDEQRPFEDVVDAGRSSPWIKFETDRLPWFDNTFWAGCYACVRPGGEQVAVVAWTDTD